MCNCIKEIEERINLEKNAIYATVGSFSHQSSEISYRPIRLDGEPSRHNRYTSVKWKYCPFCSEEIERE